MEYKLYGSFNVHYRFHMLDCVSLNDPLQSYLSTSRNPPPGDMDLNPADGQYRLQASIPGVEVNGLRATLGVRPIPFPMAGAVRGVLHATGPLEKPIFSGRRRHGDRVQGELQEGAMGGGSVGVGPGWVVVVKGTV